MSEKSLLLIYMSSFPWPPLAVLGAMPGNISAWVASIHSDTTGGSIGRSDGAAGSLPARSPLPKKTGELIIFSHLCLLPTESCVEQNQGEAHRKDNSLVELKRRCFDSLCGALSNWIFQVRLLSGFAWNAREELFFFKCKDLSCKKKADMEDQGRQSAAPPCLHSCT